MTVWQFATTKNRHSLSSFYGLRLQAVTELWRIRGAEPQSKKVSAMRHLDENKLSLMTKGWRYQLAIAFSLMSVIPLLTFGYFLTSYLMPSAATKESVVGVMTLNLMLSIAGLTILTRIVKALSRRALPADD